MTSKTPQPPLCGLTASTIDASKLEPKTVFGSLFMRLVLFAFFQICIGAILVIFKQGVFRDASGYWLITATLTNLVVIYWIVVQLKKEGLGYFRSFPLLSRTGEKGPAVPASRVTDQRTGGISSQHRRGKIDFWKCPGCDRTFDYTHSTMDSLDRVDFLPDHDRLCRSSALFWIYQATDRSVNEENLARHCAAGFLSCFTTLHLTAHP